MVCRVCGAEAEAKRCPQCGTFQQSNALDPYRLLIALATVASLTLAAWVGYQLGIVR